MLIIVILLLLISIILLLLGIAGIRNSYQEYKQNDSHMSKKCFLHFLIAIAFIILASGGIVEGIFLFIGR